MNGSSQSQLQMDDRGGQKWHAAYGGRSVSRCILWLLKLVGNESAYWIDLYF